MDANGKLDFDLMNQSKYNRKNKHVVPTEKMPIFDETHIRFASEKVDIANDPIMLAQFE